MSSFKWVLCYVVELPAPVSMNQRASFVSVVSEPRRRAGTKRYVAFPVDEIVGQGNGRVSVGTPVRVRVGDEVPCGRIVSKAEVLREQTNVILTDRPPYGSEAGRPWNVVSAVGRS